MKRKDFFKRLFGAAAIAVVAPQILAEKINKPEGIGTGVWVQIEESNIHPLTSFYSTTTSTTST